jgi:hypothetical protein
MRIRTSDNVIINSFEKIQATAGTVRDTPVMKNVSRRESPGEVSYNGRRICINNHNKLTAQIPNVLDDMCTCICRGEVYSGNSAVFREKFAKGLNFLLAWLCSIQLRDGVAVEVGVSASIVRNVLQQLVTVVKRVCAADVAYITSIIKKI